MNKKNIKKIILGLAGVLVVASMFADGEPSESQKQQIENAKKEEVVNTKPIYDPVKDDYSEPINRPSYNSEEKALKKQMNDIIRESFKGASQDVKIVEENGEIYATITPNKGFAMNILMDVLTWDNIADDLCSASGSYCKALRSIGCSDDINIIVLNDANKSKILLHVKNGKIIYKY